MKGPRTYLVRSGNQIRFVHADRLKGTGGDPFWGSVACSRKSSLTEELVESQAIEEECLVLPEPLPSEFSTPRQENSAVADKAEEQLVFKETQYRIQYWEVLCGEQALPGYHYHHSKYQGTLVEKGKPRAG